MDEISKNKESVKIDARNGVDKIRRAVAAARAANLDIDQRQAALVLTHLEEVEHRLARMLGRAVDLA